MGEGGGGEEKPLFLFRFHFSPFPQKRLILRLIKFVLSSQDLLDVFKLFKLF